MERLVEEPYTFKGRVEDCENDYIIAVQEKLRDYEQAEEDGLLIRVECRCKDCVHVDYAGCSNTTCYCMKNGCFMQEDDFCKYAEKSKLMNTTETVGHADNGGLMSAT